MVFNGVINVMAFDVAEVEGAQHGEIVAHVGFPLPAGNGQMALIPMGVLRLPVNREGAEELIDNLKELVEKLPKASKLEVATDIAQVREEAEALERLRGDNSGAWPSPAG
jgi:hypothetical protein